jgi:hypothetical protein
VLGYVLPEPLLLALVIILDLFVADVTSAVVDNEVLIVGQA